jgi:NhaP-type Na+/H+ and K+/H+ antiporter
MNKKRMLITLITGAILGIFCVIGANVRYGGELSNIYVFAFWFNRLLMGFVFGLLVTKLPLKLKLVRGLAVGLLISFAFYSATEFLDVTGFIAGGVYGIIIEYVAHKFKA